MKATTYQYSHPQKTEHHSKTDQSRALPIRSERQYRLILAILETPRATNALIQEVGANNIPNLVMRLRESGWQIDCERITVFDRDGNKVAAGQYRLITNLETSQASLEAFKGVYSMTEKHPLNKS